MRRVNQQFVAASLTALLSLGCNASKEQPVDGSYGAYVAPTMVEILPGSPARATIHGEFIVRVGGGGYLVTRGCGKMVFSCRSGEEELCNRQWQKIREAIGTRFCQGFGAATLNTAGLVLDENDLSSLPTEWDTAAGVGSDDYVEKLCPVARQSWCVQLASADMSVRGVDASAKADM